MVAFFKLHLARGSGSIMGSLLKVLFALCSYPHMCSLFSVHIARRSASNIGPPFKLHLAGGSSSIMGSPFKVLLVRVSDLNFVRFSVYLGVVFVVLR